MRVEIDYELCTGHGRCYDLAPELFDCDDEGLGQVKHGDVPTGLESDARRAEMSCPEQAIRALE